MSYENNEILNGALHSNSLTQKPMLLAVINDSGFAADTSVSGSSWDIRMFPLGVGSETLRVYVRKLNHKAKRSKIFSKLNIKPNYKSSEWRTILISIEYVHSYVTTDAYCIREQVSTEVQKCHTHTHVVIYWACADLLYEI